MNRASPIAARVLQWLAAALLFMAGAQPAEARNHIDAELLAESATAPGGTVELAIHFRPEPGWHGYWSNPGDAGFGMRLDWTLPRGAAAGKPLYPVPQTLLVQGLMNHVYERDYAVLVPLTLPTDLPAEGSLPIAVKADWLACTDTICVPESAVLAATLQMGRGMADPRFDTWRAAIPPVLAGKGRFALGKGRLRIAIPLPRDVAVPAPHLFLENDGLIQYAGGQSFSRKGDLIIADLPLRTGAAAPAGGIEGILRTTGGDGFAFRAAAGPVPAGGVPVVPEGGIAPLAWLILGALAGGLLLNLMPCVFPILSLKALSLARAGESQAQALREGLAYTAGTVTAALGLGAVLLLLRAGGEQVGWAFQLQDPRIVVGLCLLAVAITANFAGLFRISGPSLERGGGGAGAFATGLLAAFVATPCTGPFMAAALGAALLLPPPGALALFAALGLGLGAPFLLLGLVPPLRRLLPRPGPWMERFRRWMAVPMGLAGVALLWLAWRLGGTELLRLALLLAVWLLAVLALVGRSQGNGGKALPLFAAGALGLAVLAVAAWPSSFAAPGKVEGGLLQARPFSEQALAAARATGRPVFLWFTADWCITCKVNERVAIEREATRAAFRKAGVIVLKGDWTRRDPSITRFLTQQGVAGVPLYLWYPPRGEGQRLSQLLAPDALTTLARQRVLAGPARGTPGTAGQAPR